MKKLILFTLTMVFCTGYLMAQRTVSGAVLDDTGEPLIGATILAKGTTVGTITDFDGNFSLVVPDEANKLIISYTGFDSQELDIAASGVMNVTMFEGVQLGEVLITGLGKTKTAKSAGYSVAKVSSDQVVQIAEPDPLRALQGKVAGVDIGGSGGAPGSSTRITIRGNSSLLGNNQPLFIVDGIPFDNSEYSTSSQLSSGGAYGSRIGDIDPNNIESVNILKGAAASALYGSRASNGVVVIRTKSGSGTIADDKLSVTLSSSYGIEEIANLPDYQNSYGTGTNFNYGQVNGSWGAPFIGAQPYAKLAEIPHWYAGRAGLSEFDGQTVPYQAYPTNVEDLFRTGKIYDNSLSISGGTGNTFLSATLSYLRNDGFVPNTDYTRAALSVGGNTQLDNGISVGFGLSYTNSQQNGVISGVGGSGANNNSAFARALYLGRNWDVHGQPYQNPLDLGSEFMVGRGQADNPLWSYENAGIKADVDRIATNLNLGYQITDNIGINYIVGVNQYTQRNTDFIRPGSTGPSANPGQGQITNDNISFRELESNISINYSKYLTTDLSFDIVVGHSFNERRTDRQAYRGLGYVIFDIDDIDNTNSVVPFGGTFQKRRIIGAFSEIVLGYKNYLYLTVTGRNDWSSTLPKDNRSYFYPSAAVSFVASEALGLSSNSALSYLKFRASASQVGNDTNPYQLQPVFLINSFLITNPQPTASLPFGGIAGASLSNIQRNPDLKPERTREYEAGVDANFFNNRIGIEFTYYDKLSKDLIAPVTLPSSTGFTQLFTNFGELSNKGIEIGLDLNPLGVSENGLNWNIYGTFTKNKNVIESLREGVEEITIAPGTSFAGSVSAVHKAPTMDPVTGEVTKYEYGLLMGPVNARHTDGSLLIDASNGQYIRALDEEIIGNPNPDFQVGLNNTFSYKGASFRVVWDWSEGGDLFSNTVVSMLGRGVTQLTEDRELNRVIPGIYGDANTGLAIMDESGNVVQNQTQVEVNTLYFGETYAINGAEEWQVFDATVYRLREASLGYSFPKSFLENSPFGGLDISVSGRNLWFFAPGLPESTNFDPETNQFGATNKQGIEYSTTPSTRRFSLNLRAKF